MRYLSNTKEKIVTLAAHYLNHDPPFPSAVRIEDRQVDGFQRAEGQYSVSWVGCRIWSPDMIFLQLKNWQKCLDVLMDLHQNPSAGPSSRPSSLRHTLIWQSQIPWKYWKVTSPYKSAYKCNISNQRGLCVTSLSNLKYILNFHRHTEINVCIASWFASMSCCCTISQAFQLDVRIWSDWAIKCDVAIAVTHIKIRNKRNVISP